MAAGVEELSDSDVSPEVIEMRVHRKAEEALQILCRRLEGNSFVLGQKPSSVDALVYAYVAPVLISKLPNKSWQNKVANYAEVVAFVNRITRTYFPPRVEYSSEKAEKSKEGEEEDGKPLVPLKYNVMSCLVAAAAMSAYAYFSGLYRVFHVRY